MSRHHFLPDMVALIGTLDLVFGSSSSTGSSQVFRLTRTLYTLSFPQARSTDDLFEPVQLEGDFVYTTACLPFLPLFPRTYSMTSLSLLSLHSARLPRPLSGSVSHDLAKEACTEEGKE